MSFDWVFRSIEKIWSSRKHEVVDDIGRKPFLRWFEGLGDLSIERNAVICRILHKSWYMLFQYAYQIHLLADSCLMITFEGQNCEHSVWYITLLTCLIPISKLMKTSCFRLLQIFSILLNTQLKDICLIKLSISREINAIYTYRKLRDFMV